MSLGHPLPHSLQWLSTGLRLKSQILILYHRVQHSLASICLSSLISQQLFCPLASGHAGLLPLSLSLSSSTQIPPQGLCVCCLLCGLLLYHSPPLPLTSLPLWYCNLHPCLDKSYCLSLTSLMYPLAYLSQFILYFHFWDYLLDICHLPPQIKTDVNTVLEGLYPLNLALFIVHNKYLINVREENDCHKGMQFSILLDISEFILGQSQSIRNMYTRILRYCLTTPTHYIINLHVPWNDFISGRCYER